VPAAAAPSPEATPGAGRAAEPAASHDQALRVALATARVRALVAAIEFNAIRLILANLQNDQPVIDALNQTLNFLTKDREGTGQAIPEATPQASGTPVPEATPGK
jgi:hypothetical protein